MVWFITHYTNVDMKPKGQLTRPWSYTQLGLWLRTQVAVGFMQVMLLNVGAQVGAVARMRACASPREAPAARLHWSCHPRMQNYSCQQSFFQKKLDAYKKCSDCKCWPTSTTCAHILLYVSEQKVSMRRTSPIATVCHLWESKTTGPWQNFLSPILFHSFLLQPQSCIYSKI